MLCGFGIIMYSIFSRVLASLLNLLSVLSLLVLVLQSIFFVLRLLPKAAVEYLFLIILTMTKYEFHEISQQQQS